MPRDRLVSISIVVLAVAWFIAIPALYLLQAVWFGGLDGAIMRHVSLRPYALYIGNCPFLVFWTGCIFAAIVGIPGPKTKPYAFPAAEPKVLIKIAIVLSIIGNCIGAVLGTSVLFFLFLSFVTGHMYVTDALVFAVLGIVVFFALAYAYRRVGSVYMDSPSK